MACHSPLYLFSPFFVGALSALGLGYGLHRRVVAQYQQWYETQYAKQQATADMQQQQLQQQLEQQQHELDGLDVERDRLTQELRQYYGKLTSASEKLRQLEQLRQHNHDLSDKLDTVREEKSELLAELREVKASAEQQLNAAKEKTCAARKCRGAITHPVRTTCQSGV